MGNEKIYQISSEVGTVLIYLSSSKSLLECYRGNKTGIENSPRCGKCERLV